MGPLGDVIYFDVFYVCELLLLLYIISFKNKLGKLSKTLGQFLLGALVGRCIGEQQWLQVVEGISCY